MKIPLIILTISIILNSCIVLKLDLKDENFKIALLEQIDRNKNKKIDHHEIKNTIKLKLDEKNISNISGIEAFKNLIYLNLRKNKVSDFSKINSLKNLQELIIGDNNKINQLDLGKLENLKVLRAFGLGLKNINIKSTRIESLSLQDNSFITIETANFPELSTLNLDGCSELTNLNLTKNTKLREIYLFDTSIKTLNVSENKTLKTIYVEENVKLIKNENQDKLKPAPIIIQN